MNEKPTENRIFTGSDEPISAEKAGNIIGSPEYDKEQKNRIKDLVVDSDAPTLEAERRMRQVLMAISLIRDSKDGDLLATILECRYAGYSVKKVAKTLLKSERDNLPTFSSLTKAEEFVKKAEKEGLYRVNVALSKRRSI